MLTAILDRGVEVIAERPVRHGKQPAGSIRRAWFVLPVIVAVASGMWGAGSRQLWLDEYASWWGATLSWRDLWRLNSHIDSVQAPYYVVLHLWIGAAGTSPLALRMPSIVAGVLTVVCIMCVAGRMYGQLAAVMSGLALVGVPYFALYQQTARPYSLAVAFACLACLLLARAVEQPSVWRWVLYGGVLAALGAMHLVALLVLPAHGAAVLLASRRVHSHQKRLVIGWMIAVAVVVLVLSPLVWRGHEQSFQIGEGVNSANQAVFLVTYAFWSKMSAAVIVWGAVVGASFVRTSSVQRLLVVAWGVLPYAIAVPTVGILNLASLRYLLFALPPWVILACAGVAHLAMSPVRHLKWFMPLALALSVVCAIPGQIDVRRDPFVGYPDYRSAIASIAARVRPGDGIAEAGPASPGSRRLAVEYQFRDRAVRPRELFEVASPQQAGWFIGDYCSTPNLCVVPAPRVWLLTTSPLPDPLADTGFAIPRAGGVVLFGAEQGPYLKKHYDVLSVQVFTAVRVVLLTRRN